MIANSNTAQETASKPSQPAAPRSKTPVLKIILIAMPIILVAFLCVVALQPSQFRVARRATMSAPASAVYAQVNDFHNWEAWSPWAKLDPAAKNSFEGPSAGIGAIFRWAGNSEVGEGSMTITESRPSEVILIKLEFLKPFAGTNIAEFTFQPEGDETVLTGWFEDQSALYGALAQIEALGLELVELRQCRRGQDRPGETTAGQRSDRRQ